MSADDVHREDMFDEDPTLAAFARDLQEAAAATPAPAIGAALAAVLEGRAPATAYPEVVDTPRARTVRRPARLRWAVAAGALTLGTGSLGVAGALPGPVQRQVARMAEVIGVDVPDGEDDAPTTTTTVPTTTTTSTTLATTTSTAPPVGTTVLSGEQDAGEDKPGKPDKPEREDDDDSRGRGRGGDGGEDDEADEADDGDDDSSGPGSGDLGDDELEHRGDAGSVDDRRRDDSGSPGSGTQEPGGDDVSQDVDLDEDDGKSSDEA